MLDAPPTKADTQHPAAPSESKRGRWLLTAAGVLGLAVALVVGAGVLVGPRAPSDPSAPAAAPSGTTPLDRQVGQLQQQLRVQPGDWRSWASLGLVYVEKGRLTGDPTWYPKSEEALQRSLELEPTDNDTALTGMAALAAARHDFAGAVNWAQKALAVNGFSSAAYAVLGDGLIELGRYEEGFAAITRADELLPGVSTFTRVAYTHELRGQTDQAVAVLNRALDSASTPADLAYVHHQLGQLAWFSGDLATAERHYAAALTADETFVPALAGQARVAGARGDSPTALRHAAAAAERLPTVEHLVLLGELHESAGAVAEAQAQYDVVRAQNAIAADSGVNVDLEAALFEADHGDPTRALATAEAEWNRRHSVHAADAYAWALHAAGRDAEALPIARQAVRLGTKDPTFLYHLGMIELELGQRDAARQSLSAAVTLNPAFSPVHGPAARAALDSLEVAQ